MADPTHLPIYVRIQQFIRSQIAGGRLREGDRIATELELARHFDTSRATVARAIQQLVYEGVILRRPGSGSFVSTRAITAPLQLTRVYSFEDKLSAEGASIDYQILAFSSQSASETWAHQLHLDAGGLVYQLRRLRIVSRRRMSLEVRIFPAALGQRMTVEMLQNQSVHQILASLSMPVRHVEGKIRACLADGALAQDMDVREGSALLVRDYVLTGDGRHPLVCGESYYRPDFHIDYQVEDTGRMEQP